MQCWPFWPWAGGHTQYMQHPGYFHYQGIHMPEYPYVVFGDVLIALWHMVGRVYLVAGLDANTGRVLLLLCELVPVFDTLNFAFLRH